MSKDNHVTNNFRVLASLTDIFQQLAEHHALIGRLGSTVVIDASKAPILFLDELTSIFQASHLTSKNSGMNVFSNFQSDGKSETIMLDASIVLRQGFEDFKEVPALREIYRLIKVIPPLPQDLAEHYAAISEDISGSIKDLMETHRSEILQALLCSSDDETVQAQESTTRTLN